MKDLSSIITANKLTKAFGGLYAVQEVDFAVEMGHIHGVIGPNGSGKTTMLNTISGIYRPTNGHINFCGERVDGLPPYKLVEKGIARTFQNIRLFPRLNVLENVMVGQYCRTKAGLVQILLLSKRMIQEERLAVERAKDALDFVGLSERARSFPGDLPYGQQRLVEMARALATQPKLLLLDEPSAGMNITEKRNLANLIAKIKAEKSISIIVIEHDIRLISGLCDRVTVLNFGRKIAEGTPAEIRSNNEVIEAYLGRGRKSVNAG